MAASRLTLSTTSNAWRREQGGSAGGTTGRDGTVYGKTYGKSRTSATSFYVHHVQQLAAAAQVGDAKAIRRKITEHKMRLMKVALKAGGGGY